MVQVFDASPTPSSASMLGNAIGVGINKNFPDPQQMVQRGMLQKALSEAGAIAKSENSNPIDIMTSFMQAGAGIPGFEKYAGTILPKILEMAAYKKDIGGGGSDSLMTNQQTPNGQPTPQSQDQIQQPPFGQTQTNNQPENLPPLSLGEYIPVDVGNYIGPEAQRKIIEDVAIRGGDPSLVKERIRDYNQGLINYNELINSNVDKKSAQMQRQLGLEKQVKGFIDSQLSPDIPEARKNIYYDIMKKELANSPDLTTAYQKASPKIQSFEKQVKEFPSKIPEAGSFDIGMNQSTKGMLRNISKNMMDIDPLAYPILEQMLVQKGHPITDVAEILNPLPNNVSSIVNKAQDYRPVVYTNNTLSENAMIKSLDNTINEQMKSAPNIAKDLQKNWSEKLSLINVYTELQKKAWFPQAIHEVFNELKNSGVPMSAQQEAEIVQLGQRPQITVQKLSE
jgi:hypothetical protein